MAVGLCMGGSVWADDVVSYNFDGQTTPFVISDASRLSASYAFQTGSETDYYVKYSCGNMNGVAFAYYDFSASVSDATTVTIDFDFNIAAVAGHGLISIADASVHTASGGGFTGKSNTGYGANGAIFNLGCFRSGNNKFAINSTQNDLAGLGVWCHAQVVVDHSTKKVSYVITKDATTLASADNINFLNASANRCSQIDLYLGTNATGNGIQIDNLVITKTVSETEHTYTINAMAGVTKLQELATGEALEYAGYSVSVPKVIVKDGKYYVLNNGQDGLNNCQASYTMGTADVTKEIAYTLDESVIYFREAEDINSGQKYTSATSSNGYACGYYATPVTITISQPGYYELETNVTGRDGNSSLDLYTADGTEAVASFAKNIGTGIKTLNFFADANMRVGGPYYNDKFNNSKSIDYILVRKIAEVIDVNHEFVGAFDFSTTANGAISSNYTLKQGETKVITFQNHGQDFGKNWRINVKEGETWKANVRADSWDEVANAATKVAYRESKDGGSSTVALDWTDFTADMADAEVVATLAYGTDGKLAITTTSTGSANGYIYYVDQDVTGLTSDLTINLSVNESWLEVLSVEQTAYAVTIPSSSYGTLAVADGLDFSDVDGLTAYVVSSITPEYARLTAVNELPANTGMILKGTPSATYSIPVKADAAFDGTNYLQAAVTATDIAANEAYILQSGEFHLVTAASTIPAGKAYLLAEDVPANAHALSFSFEDDETTGIKSMHNAEFIMHNNEVYNLNGQRIEKPTKGLYIKNGKKVVIK